MTDTGRGVDLPDADAELSADIDRRIAEFEAAHETDVLHDRPGWVPRIRRVDHAIAIAVNPAKPPEWSPHD